ncbi:MAG: hypothetical protein KME46_00595 [Brasilonema angustatum HA4187-MV1]|nr:hypothetical protein [Brasilonema angustatum HA4187-MV1]
MTTRVESDQMYFSCKEIHLIIHNYIEILSGREATVPLAITSPTGQWYHQ